ncbi:hypothetical protein V1517DRAFT_325388 [Lipomyces orientalis]|uniref:Uncharacterized protein n=1 Tax=Lipomyces orientalis TaxID=1233043 RepID=A0ACC3TNT0_9ASCO
MATLAKTRLVPRSGLLSASKPQIIPTSLATFGASPVTVTAVRYNSGGSGSLNYFQSSRNAPRPANTIIRFVPQQTAYIVERMGKFNRILNPGIAILIPIIDKIQYVKSLKESAIEIPSQSAITADNVTLDIDGVLYIRVFDAYKASYGVEDADYAVQQLAQTTMRSEIGQLTLDHVLKERQQLNVNITQAINEAASDWGIKCLRYEIRDIHPPANVLEAMHRQVSAERSKRAEILDSEGQRQSAINIAEGRREAVILASEAEKAEVINKATGEAQAILVKAEATAEGIRKIAQAIAESPKGSDAVSLQIAEQYVEAFSKLAKKSNTIIVPSQLGDIGGWIASGMGIYNKIKESTSESLATSAASGEISTSGESVTSTKKE